MDSAMLRAALQEYVLSQPWWKRKANTVTGAWTGMLMVVWIAIGSGAEMPYWVTLLGGGLLYVGQLLGLSKTPNGVTPGVVEQVTAVVEESYGRHAARPGNPGTVA